MDAIYHSQDIDFNSNISVYMYPLNGRLFYIKILLSIYTRFLFEIF